MTDDRARVPRDLPRRGARAARPRSSTRCSRSRPAGPTPTRSTRSSATPTRSRAPPEWSASTRSCALAHAMEDVLSVARDGGSFPPELVAPLLRAADALRRHVDGAGEPVADLVDELALQGSGAAATIARRPGPGGRDSGGRRRPGDPARKETAERRRPAERRSIRVPAEKIDTLLDLVGETVLHRRRLEHALGERARRARTPAGLGRARPRRAPAGRAQGRRDRHADAAAVVDHGAAPARRSRPRLRDRQGGRAGRRRRRDRARPGHPRGAPRDPGPPAPQRDRARHRGARTSGCALGKPARGRLELRAEQRGGLVEITVSDDGRGVSEEALAEGRRTRLPRRRARVGRLLDGQRGERHLRPRGRPRRRQGARWSRSAAISRCGARRVAARRSSCACPSRSR